MPYTLKLDREIWKQIDRNRQSLNGVLSADPLTKKTYILNAILAYNEYWDHRILPKIASAKRDTDETLPFFYENGVDVSW